MMKKLIASIKKIAIKMPKLDLSKTKVGIQLGERAIKVVVLKKGKNKSWEVVKEIVEPISEDIIKGGKVLQPELLGLKIREIFRDGEINVKKAALFLEEMLFFTRQINLPKMPKKEVETSLHYKAQLDIPDDMKKLTLSYSLINTVEEEGIARNKYVVIAAYKEQIKQVVSALKTAGLSISMFGTEPDAVYEGIKFSGALSEDKELIMAVKMLNNRMMIAIYDNGKLIYSRYTPFGFDSEEWGAEIERSIVSWDRTHVQSRIQEVLLLGDKERWSMIKESIKSSLEIDVRVVSFPNAPCIGIASKELGSDNLYKEQSLQITSEMSSSTKIAITAIIVLLFGFIFVQGQSMQLKKDINLLEKNIASASETVALLDREIAVRALLSELTEVQLNLADEHIDIISIINRMTPHQPASVRISQLSFSSNQLNVTGTAANQVDVIAFLKGLQSDPYFSVIKLNHATRSDEVVQFVFEVNEVRSGGGPEY
ncbi:pilus assembly protein PilM [Anaerobacillus sp. MEB173]|uniref:pilus assembly protein PilM n=1 Tax=Anaerobacillus sp. MEB173 TaxID=3383345 RepID=UPI003F8E3BE2